MKESDQTSQINKKVKAFPVPFRLRENQENITVITNTPSNLSKEQIISQAFKFHSKGNILEAEKYYQYFINKGFKDHRVFSNYGVLLQSLGKLHEGERALRKAIQIKPDEALAHSNLGNILKHRGNLKEAERVLRKAIELQPELLEAYFNLGSVLKDLSKLKEAEVFLRKAFVFKSDSPEAHNNLGNILRDLGQLKEAKLLIRKAIAIKPDYSNAHNNLGIIYRDLDQLKDAERSLRKAVKIDPYYAEAHNNLGNTLRDLGQLEEAESLSRKAIELNPDLSEAYFNLSLTELLKGNYKSGLANYEYRFKAKKSVRTHANTKLEKFNHQKKPAEKKILVISEQGLGDTLQFMRYVPYLRDQGRDVYFCTQEKLHSLIQVSGIDPHPLTPEQTNQISDGVWMPLMSLPKHLEVNPSNPIISKRYISSSEELIQKWKTILSREERPIIGINWQGNPKAERTTLKGRSLALEKFAEIAKKNNLKLLSLQKGFGSDQLHHCSFKNRFVNCQPQINSTWDFLENAAIIENCDLIITSDTSIAHLAGGMGKLTWILLQHIPDWRWGLEGNNTFWYPSVKLFRQTERNNWQTVMEKVSSQIKTKFLD